MIRRLLIVALAVAPLLGCAEERKKEIRLTLPERERLDNMVNARVDSLRPLLRADCDSTFADRVDAAVDSIVQERLEE